MSTRTVATIYADENTPNQYRARVIYDNEWEEYRVKFYYHSHHFSECDYHAGDKDDAINTAKIELQRMVQSNIAAHYGVI